MRDGGYRPASAIKGLCKMEKITSSFWAPVSFYEDVSGSQMAKTAHVTPTALSRPLRYINHQSAKSFL